MGPFLLAVVVCATIAVWANPHVPWSAFWEKPEFWQTWLPTWLQGAGTLAAAWVAWRAFATWRLQEAGRRRVSAAEDLMRRVLVLARLLREARQPDGGQSVGEKMKSVRERTQRELISRATETAEGLEVDLLMYGSLGFGRGTALGLAGLMDIGQKMRHAAWIVTSAGNPDGEEDQDVLEQVCRKSLSVLFTHYGVRRDIKWLAQNDDEVDQRIGSCVRIIEKELGPIIAGK